MGEDIVDHAQLAIMRWKDGWQTGWHVGHVDALANEVLRLRAEVERLEIELTYTRETEGDRS